MFYHESVSNEYHNRLLNLKKRYDFQRYANTITNIKTLSVAGHISHFLIPIVKYFFLNFKLDMLFVLSEIYLYLNLK